jgi:predicted DNA-binding transcriptional regulator YafY
LNRIDRLLGHILVFQGRGRRRPITAEALAARFEVSKRTVYRDLEALCELGVPLQSIPGRGYALLPGYDLPPAMFTADEASTLALAGGLFRHFVAHERRRALETALRKIDVVLPEAARAAVDETRRRVVVSSWPHRAAPLDGELPLLIQRAMAERRVLGFRYHSRSGSSGGAGVSGSAGVSDEALEPHALVFYAGDWHAVGHSRRHAARRQFRLSRIESPRLLEERYVLPDDVESQADAFWAAMDDPGRTGNCVARIRFGPTTARWARERRHYAWESETETADGLEVGLRCERWEEVLPWLLGWGGDVEVLAPRELQERLLGEADRIRQRYRQLP